jgi:hypothetical protein
MFDRLFGRKQALGGDALPIVAMWRSAGRWCSIRSRGGGSETRCAFPFDGDTLQIVAQGLVKLSDGGFVHRFYTDDDVMFQAVSNDPGGQDVTDVTLFAPWDSQYPSTAAERPPGAAV